MFREQDLLPIASATHGVVSLRQARALGLTPAGLRNLRKSGRWELASPRVLLATASPRTSLQQAMAAVLDAGGDAVLSHSSAGAWWGAPGFTLVPAQVIRRRPTEHCRAFLAVVHRPLLLLDEHVCVSDGVTVTSPARTLFDLASVVHPARLERLVDRFWSERLVTGFEMHAMLAVLAGRGRTGIKAMRDVLDDRPADHRPTESGLELRFGTLMARAGMAFDRQVDLGGADGWIARVDFLHRPTRLVVFVDSDRFHTSPTDRHKDAGQDAALRAAGYAVERVNERQLWHTPEALIDHIRTLLDARQKDATGPKTPNWGWNRAS
jgi:very-short-patch-repair endonuclease